MQEIQSALLALLPARRKPTLGGWLTFSAVCCHHRGESRDTRDRGGLLLTPKGGWIYHCFNCQFAAGWSPGKLLSSNTRLLFKWVGMSEFDIQKLALIALKGKEDLPKAERVLNFDLKEIDLPDGCLPILEWTEQELSDDLAAQLLDVCKYVQGRSFDPLDGRFFWTPLPGYQDRVIVPFYHDGKIVGYTGRKVREGKPKYLTDSQSGYVFNLDKQHYTRKFLIVVEGQFDALAIDGVAIMTNQPNDTQIARINSLGKQVIVVPDRDRAGSRMINAAIDNNWAVSIPPWGDDIKDVSDAVKQYGRLYTMSTILHYCETNHLKIKIIKKKLENINE